MYILTSILSLCLMASFAAPQYKLLHKALDQGDGAEKQALCVISIDDCINEIDLKVLLKELISKEIPNDREEIMISIYYRLDKYNPNTIPDIFNSTGPARNLQMIAMYYWIHKNSLKRNSFIIINPKYNCGIGNNERIPFDHTQHQ
jgi:hypothetical protein